MDCMVQCSLSAELRSPRLELLDMSEAGASAGTVVATWERRLLLRLWRRTWP